MPVILADYQIKPTEDLTTRTSKGLSSLLIGATGIGKTFILGQTLRNLYDSGYFSNFKTYGFPVIYITDNTVVPQTTENLLIDFGLPPNLVFITNYAQLRATLGTLFLEWFIVGKHEVYNPKTQLLELKDKELPIWKSAYAPKLIIADEFQKVKNSESLQHEVLENAVIQGIQVIGSSATPFTRVNEAKIAALMIKPLFRGPEDRQKVPLTKENWPYFAQEIAGSITDIAEFNFAAVGRMREALNDGLVRVSGVKFKKRTLTHCKLVPFANDQDRKVYMDAYEEWLRLLAKIDRSAPGGIAEIWVATNKFRQKAELIRSPYLAQIGLDVVNSLKKQVIIGSNFIEGIDKVKSKLLELGVKPERIAEIRGGQTLEIREKNKLRFQTGKADFILLTIKAGGVGISLHHHEKNSKVCKPRYVLASPPWSAIELIQFLGRAHRMNSISTTHQTVVGFKGTAEEDVLEKLKLKFSCLSELVGKRETWTDLFAKQKTLEDINELKNLSSEDDLELESELPAEAFDNPTEVSEEDLIEV